MLNVIMYYKKCLGTGSPTIVYTPLNIPMYINSH